MGALVRGVYGGGRKECKCEEMAVRLRGRKVGVGRGIIVELVGRRGLAYGMETGGCGSCEKRRKGVTGGVLGEGFGTRGPGRG